MSGNRAPWVVVLAGGAGTRLASLTRARDGALVPKQFCTLRGGPSLLQETLDRASLLTSSDRVLVVVTAEHARWWRPQLASLDPGNVLVQPQARGTAAGIAWPLREVLQRDPRARVVTMPSDHHVAKPAVALDAVRRALLALGDADSRVILLGIAPDGAETGYGWVLPRAASATDVPVAPAPFERPAPIERFVEKPPAALAAALWRQGALWNSFLVVAEARALFDELASGAPVVAAAFDGAYAFGTPSHTALLALYRGLPELDFSRAVLEPAARRLTVLAVPACGWTDLGTPPRVQQCLAVQRDGSWAASGAAASGAAPVVLAHALDRRRVEADG